MTEKIDRNIAFLTNIFRQGPFEGHAFIAKPKSIPIHTLPNYDFTLSDRPIEEWVPWIVENYEREVHMHEALEDDSVPTAKIATGTHIYAAAFGAGVHAYEDNNPLCQDRCRVGAAKPGPGGYPRGGENRDTGAF